MSGTIKVLNVAEKPSVAKSVSGLLSRNQGLRVREGRSRFNKIFEFNYSIRGQPCHMLFTSVTGHLMEVEFEDRFRKWHSCDPADLYHASVRKFVPEVSFLSSIFCFFLLIYFFPFREDAKKTKVNCKYQNHIPIKLIKYLKYIPYFKMIDLCEK